MWVTDFGARQGMTLTLGRRSRPGPLPTKLLSYTIAKVAVDALAVEAVARGIGTVASVFAVEGRV